MTEYVGTAILVDLDGAGLRLVGIENAVTFDLDADGTPDRVTWTSADGDDAFLALDVNQNGRIDDGAELFGNAMVLKTGVRASNGYAALAHLDTTAAGGDGDGVITAADAIFEMLRLWIDRNHNGVSDDGELLTLSDGGVVALDTRFTESNHMDSYRNLFRYKSQARLRAMNGQEHTSNTYDVLFWR